MNRPTNESRSAVYGETKTARGATCGGCPARWTAHNTSHCGKCHETFTSVSGFDQHRRADQCAYPGNVGLVWLRNRNGWGYAPIDVTARDFPWPTPEETP